MLEYKVKNVIKETDQLLGVILRLLCEESKGIVTINRDKRNHYTITYKDKKELMSLKLIMKEKDFSARVTEVNGKKLKSTKIRKCL